MLVVLLYSYAGFTPMTAIQAVNIVMEAFKHSILTRMFLLSVTVCQNVKKLGCIIQLNRPPFLHFMYYMDCKEIFPSPFNSRMQLRYSLNKNSSDLKLRDIFKVSQSLTFSIIHTGTVYIHINKSDRGTMRTGIVCVVFEQVPTMP